MQNWVGIVVAIALVVQVSILIALFCRRGAPCKKWKRR